MGFEMSMHLVGPYLTTTNYRKRKSKVTQSQMNRWMEGWREKCKQNKRLGLAKPTFEEYVDALHGRVKIEKPKFVPLQVKDDPVMNRIRQHKELYPSGNGFGSASSTAKKEPQKYTGTLIKGIATMHKSNAVPVIDSKQAIEISQMRRN
jgi:hypothetical protein